MADPVVLKEGYEQLPAADVKTLKDAADGLKGLRAMIPEEYRGKEKDFFESVSARFKELDTLKNSGKSEVEKITTELDTIKKENATLKGTATKEKNELTAQLETAKKENHNLKMWGHISRQLQLRNTGMIDDAFFDDATIASFDLSVYDLSGQEGQKKFSDDFFVKIVEPALKRQDAAFQRYQGYQNAPAPNGQPVVTNTNAPAVPHFNRMGAVS